MVGNCKGAWIVLILKKVGIITGPGEYVTTGLVNLNYLVESF